MLAILSGVKQLNHAGDTKLYRLNFVDENGIIIDPPEGVVSLSGYVIPVSGSALTANDTIQVAFGKLEARIVVLEAAISAGYGA